MDSFRQYFLTVGLVCGVVILAPCVQAKPQAEVSGWHLSDQKFAKLEQDLLELQRSGKTLWMSEQWMKDKAYYESLSTTRLAEECFSRPIFWAESGTHNDSRVMYLRLRIFHHGFAELFERDDLWKGILHVLDVVRSKVNMRSNRNTLFKDTSLLECTWAIMAIPQLQDQLKGREKIFIKAHLDILKRLRSYLGNYDPGSDPWTSIPFVCESNSVFTSASELARRQDPDRWGQSRAPVGPGGHQDKAALERYLDSAIANLQQFLSSEIE